MKSSLLVFDLIGRLAHFRKFYTNSSSLTYDFPPPTVICGIISAILGKERDSYYELFSPEKTLISLSIQQPVRKIMQTINYVRTEDADGFSNPKKILLKLLKGERIPYQVPMELLLPERNSLNYRIYFQHTDEKIMEDLKHQLENGFSIYPLYLGMSEFIADFQYIGEKDYEKRQGMAENITSVVNIEGLGEKGIDFLASEGCQFMKDRMPVAFKEGRELLKSSSFIYERCGKPFKANLKEYVSVLLTDTTTANIVFI